MAENFQDNVSYGNSTLAVSGDAVAVGSTNVGAKSVIFNNSGSQGHLAWQPSANRTINLPDSGGIIQLTGQAPGAFQAGTQTATSGTVIFSNSNGITFGMSNSSVITASYTVPNTAGLISFINISAGTTSNNLSAVTFSNSNGLTFGLNGSVITGSYTVPAIPGATVFSNSNNVSFGLAGSTVTATATFAQTNQTEGFYAVGNTTGQSSSSTFDARTMSISGVGNISLGYSNNALVISGSQSAQTQNVVLPSAGTQTATSGTVIFSNSNGITFGMSNSSVITASYTVPSTAGLISAINVSAGTTSGNLSALTFSNLNGISFGLNASTITASYTVPVQTNQTEGFYAIGNTVGQSSSSTFDARTMSISGAGIASVGYSGNAIIISVPAAGANINISAGTTSNNLNALTFSNSNGLAFGLNGSVITGSYTTPVQTAQTVGLYGLGNTTQNSSTTLDARSLSFNGLGAASVGYSNGSIQVSVPVQTAQTQSLIQAIYDGANSITTGTIRFTNANGVSFSINGQTISGSVAAQTNQTVGLYAVGNTTQNSSTTLDARSLSFNGLGNVSVGYSNGSVQISVATQTSAKVFHLLPDSPYQTNFSVSNASISLQHFVPKHAMTATQINFLMALSGNTNSSGALTISLGAYTMAGSTMSLASSVSRQITWTSGSQSTASSIYGGISGTCYRTISLPNWAITVGDYMLGVWCRTTNNGTWMMFGSQGPTIVNAQDVNETQAYLNGYYSTGSFSTNMMASVNLTETGYVRTGGPALQQPSFVFIGTV